MRKTHRRKIQQFGGSARSLLDEASLGKLGSLSRDKWVTAIVFVIMVILWVLGEPFKISTTTVAFAVSACSWR